MWRTVRSRPSPPLHGGSTPEEGQKKGRDDAATGRTSGRGGSAPRMTKVQLTLLGRFAVAVDGVAVPHGQWARRQAAAVVKVLAMAPNRTMHREQLMDLVWPDDGLDEATPKLHKAAHFARRALDVPAAVVLRGENVTLLPDADVTVDALEFDDLARRALATDDLA